MPRSSTISVLHAPRGEAVELCRALLGHLRDGNHERIPALIHRAVAAGEASREPVLAQLLEAASGIATAWSTLHKDVARTQQALADAEERARQALAPLQSVLELVLARAAEASAGRVVSIGSSAGQPESSDRFDVPARTAVEANDEDMLAPTPARVPADALSATTSLAVYVLRPFQLSINDQPVAAWTHCKAKSLFKFLLLNREFPATKELLMELFWPEADPESARNSLNVTLYNLRSTLRRVAPQLPIVVHDGGRYALDRNVRIWTDADAYLAHVRRASLLEREGRIDEAMREREACVELYRHELLAEDRYEPWIVPMREQFRDNLLNVLECLGSHYFAQENHADSVATCRRLLLIDSCNEEAHRKLMRCYARMGQPQLVQAQYRACVQALSKELGVPPSVETTAVYRSIARRADA